MLLHREELIWFQKSRCEWIQSGDRNTSHFHLKAVKRMKQNHIELFEDHNGHWISDQVELHELKTFFLVICLKKRQ